MADQYSYRAGGKRRSRYPNCGPIKLCIGLILVVFMSIQESAEAINIMAMRASWDDESFIDPGPLSDEALNKCAGSLEDATIPYDGEFEEESFLKFIESMSDGAISKTKFDASILGLVQTYWYTICSVNGEECTRDSGADIEAIKTYRFAGDIGGYSLEEPMQYDSGTLVYRICKRVSLYLHMHGYVSDAPSPSPITNSPISAPKPPSTLSERPTFAPDKKFVPTRSPVTSAPSPQPTKKSVPTLSPVTSAPSPQPSKKCNVPALMYPIRYKTSCVEETVAHMTEEAILAALWFLEKEEISIQTLVVPKDCSDEVPEGMSCGLVATQVFITTTGSVDECYTSIEETIHDSLRVLTNLDEFVEALMGDKFCPTPSASPSKGPTPMPTINPTNSPTPIRSVQPTGTKSSSPTSITADPTPSPIKVTDTPTTQPSGQCQNSLFTISQTDAFARFTEVVYHRFLKEKCSELFGQSTDTSKLPVELMQLYWEVVCSVQEGDCDVETRVLYSDVATGVTDDGTPLIDFLCTSVDEFCLLRSPSASPTASPTLTFSPTKVASSSPSKNKSPSASPTVSAVPTVQPSLSTQPSSQPTTICTIPALMYPIDYSTNCIDDTVAHMTHDAVFAALWFLENDDIEVDTSVVPKDCSDEVAQGVSCALVVTSVKITSAGSLAECSTSIEEAIHDSLQVLTNLDEYVEALMGDKFCPTPSATPSGRPTITKSSSPTNATEQPTPSPVTFTAAPTSRPSGQCQTSLYTLAQTDRLARFNKDVYHLFLKEKCSDLVGETNLANLPVELMQLYWEVVCSVQVGVCDVDTQVLYSDVAIGVTENGTPLTDFLCLSVDEFCMARSPSASPTVSPTLSSSPTVAASSHPTSTLSKSPTLAPSPAPTPKPTKDSSPSTSPTISVVPTVHPSLSTQPSSQPTMICTIPAFMYPIDYSTDCIEDTVDIMTKEAMFAALWYLETEDIEVDTSVVPKDCSDAVSPEISCALVVTSVTIISNGSLAECSTKIEETIHDSLRVLTNLDEYVEALMGDKFCPTPSASPSKHPSSRPSLRPSTAPSIAASSPPSNSPTEAPIAVELTFSMEYTSSCVDKVVRTFTQRAVNSELGCTDEDCDYNIDINVDIFNVECFEQPISDGNCSLVDVKVYLSPPGDVDEDLVKGAILDVIVSEEFEKETKRNTFCPERS